MSGSGHKRKMGSDMGAERDGGGGGAACAKPLAPKRVRFLQKPLGTVHPWRDLISRPLEKEVGEEHKKEREKEVKKKQMEKEQEKEGEAKKWREAFCSKAC